VSQGERARGGWTTHAALLVVQVAFASQAVEGKLAMMPRADGGEAVPPEALAMVRMLAAAVFFQAFSRGTGQLVTTVRRDHLHLVGLGIIGIALNQALFLIGLKHTTAMAASLLGISIPVITAALAVAFRQERPSVRTGLGVLLAASGVVWLIGVRSVDRGAIIIALNCVSYSMYIVLSRGTIQRLGAVTVITWVFTWAALLFAPFGMPALVSTMASYSPRAWWLLAYIVVLPTIVAYLFNAWALGRSSATLVTVYIYSQPVLTAILAWVQLGQSLSGRLVASAALIACGVGVVATRRATPVSPGARAPSG
jgi:drug/metabolite transporter (DMT)-like permease